MNKAEHLYRLGRIFMAYRGKKTSNIPLPVRLWIEPTPYCNLTCPMCPQSDPRINDITKGKTLMDFDLYKKIIDEAAGHVYDINLAHRGDPGPWAPPSGRAHPTCSRSAWLRVTCILPICRAFDLRICFTGAPRSISTHRRGTDVSD